MQLEKMNEKIELLMRSNEFHNEQWQMEKQDRQFQNDFLNDKELKTENYPALFTKNK